MVASAVAAVATVGGAVIGSSGAKSAAKTQANAAADANATQRYIYDTTRNDQQPWRTIGGQAIGALGQGFGFDTSGYGGSTVNWGQYGQANPDVAQAWQSMLQSGEAQERFNGDPNAYYQWHYQNFGQNEGRQAPASSAGTGPGGASQIPNFLDTFSEDDFRADPGYQFRLNEGLKAVQGSAAARGALQSGGTLKALTRFAQGTADQTYNDAYNRFNNDRTMVFNRLSSLAGLGQTANNALASAGQNYANQTGANSIAAGNGMAQSQLAQGQLWGNSLSNLGGIASNYFGQVQPSFPTPSTVPNNYAASGDTSLNGLF
jgi:hypothetical protein